MSITQVCARIIDIYFYGEYYWCIRFVIINHTVEVNNMSKILKVWIGIVVLSVVLSFCSAGGNNSNEPWRELGVSKSEYTKIYNKIKYGE